MSRATTPFAPTGTLPAPGVTLLEASAGTGKTYGIASLFLRLVAEEKIDSCRILVVTFTEAATSELRDRIRRRIGEARDALDAAIAGETVRTHDEVVRHLLDSAADDAERRVRHGRLTEALERFDDAAISTIHGFCARVLRDHAFACGVDAGAELLADPREMLAEVVRDFWDRCIATQSLDTVRALREDARLDPAVLLDVAKKAVGDPAARIEPAAANGPIDLSSLVTARQARDAARDACALAWRAHHATLPEAIAAATAAKRLGARSWNASHVRSRIGHMLAWAERPAEHDLPAQFRDYFTSDTLGAAGARLVDHPIAEACCAFADAQAALDRHASNDAASLKQACALDARARFPARLRAARQATYDDLLRMVRGALDDAQRGPLLRDALRGAYDAALIDEFQDTDGVQWGIFGTLFGGGTPHRLVLIGDPKQAIYGFRGADVHTYLAAAAGTSGARQSLSTNWRSDRRYLDAVNHLFGRHGQPFAVPGIDYEAVGAHWDTRLHDARQPLVIRRFARGPHLPPGGNQRPPSGPPSKGALEERIPGLVAADVVRFLASGAEIEERVGRRTMRRPVRPSDVAVLVRKGTQARAVQAALRAAGVPGVVRGEGSVLETREARELETVLRAILEPSNGARVRAALTTDLLGLVAGAELALAGEPPLGPGDALVRLDADDAALDRWHERLRVWRDRWDGTTRSGSAAGIAPLLHAIVAELALPERLLTLGDGERRMTNLLHLAELLHAEEVERQAEPARLAAWLGEQIAAPKASDETRQLRLETDADAAQIVTIHSSKGLEYPVVWCPYLWDGALAHEGDKQHAYYRADDGARAIHLTPAADGEECARLDDECFAENLRLLYVALTRARHRCTVWWGAASGCGTSPLGWLLHGAPASGVREAREQCASALDAITDDAVRARLDEVGHGCDAIHVEEETFAPPGIWRGATAATPALAVRSYTRAATLRDGWRYGSFTGLTRHVGAHRVGAALPEAAEDARDDAAADAAAGDAAASAPVRLAEFPASAEAGVFFHDVFERHDFGGDDASLSALVRERLEAYRFDVDRWAAPVADTIRSVLGAPIATGGSALRLRDVPRGRRVAELRFELPACGGFDAAGGAVTARGLATAFRDHPGGQLDGETLAAYADRLGKLGFAPLRGFLTGALDLVVEHEGRWWVIDWKSNRLGAAPGDYAPDRLRAEMADAHYVLQYHLYLVAMHRWLGGRVPGYDYDTHVGGACYPFLRGVGSHEATGLFVDRPPRARIEALDRLLREGA